MKRTAGAVARDQRSAGRGAKAMKYPTRAQFRAVARKRVQFLALCDGPAEWAEVDQEGFTDEAMLWYDDLLPLFGRMAGKK